MVPSTDVAAGVAASPSVDTRAPLVFSSQMRRMSPLQRAYLLGFRGGLRKARTEYRSIAQLWEDELRELQDQFNELALAHHRQCHDAAISEALLQRAMDPDMLMH